MQVNFVKLNWVRRIQRITALCSAVCILSLGTASFAQPSLVNLSASGSETEALAFFRSNSTSTEPAADGTTALMYASHRNFFNLASALLDAGANPNHTNNYGASALGEATFNGHNALVSLLLNSGANPNLTNNEGEAPLMVVARAGNIEAAELLLEAGADIDAQEHWGGQSALMWAAAQSQADMVELLINYGANTDLKGITRLWDRRITSEPRPKDMNKGGFSALHYAARQGCEECIVALVNGGAALDAIDPDRVTALNVALLNFHFDSAAALIAAGADVNKWDIYGRTPLYNAVDLNSLPLGGRKDIPSEDSLSGYDIAKMLLERGANPNAQLRLPPPFRNAVFDRGSDKVLGTGATPLIVAISTGDIESTQLLLNNGAYVDLPNSYGQTPLMIVAGVDYASSPTRGLYRTEQTSIAILEILLDAGASINALSGDPSLRPNGNDIPRPDRNRQMHPANRGPDVIEGKTALHGAARNGWSQVAQFLIDRGIRQQVIDDSGRTPLDYAQAQYPAAYNDAAPQPFPDMITLLENACVEEDHCVLEHNDRL